MPKKSTSKNPNAPAVARAATGSPLAFFQTLSPQCQEDLILKRVFELAREGDESAIRWIANNPRTQVVVLYARAYRLTKDEEDDNGERRQSIQIDINVGLGSHEDPDEWSDNFIQLLISADTADRNISWESWVIEDYECDWQGNPTNLLAILFGDWIKLPRVLQDQEQGDDMDFIPEDSLFSLDQFSCAVQTAGCWSNA